MRLAFPHESSSERLNTSRRDGRLQRKQMRGEAAGGQSPRREKWEEKQDGGWVLLLLGDAQGSRLLRGNLSEYLEVEKSTGTRLEKERIEIGECDEIGECVE